MYLLAAIAIPAQGVAKTIAQRAYYIDMEPKRAPLVLHLWLFLTTIFAAPIAALSWLMHRRMGGDPNRFKERLAQSAPRHTDPVLWFHAASLGEVMQIAPLVRYFVNEKQTNVLVTTTTATSADWVARELPEVIHQFGPIDTPATIRRFLAKWSISTAVFVEGDLWPRLLGELAKRDIPRILLNARHSRTRARFPAVFAALLSSFSLVTCRSSAVAEEMKAILGLPPDRIHILPDLRLTLPKLPAPRESVEPLSQAIGTRTVWVAASTHKADEEAVISAHQAVLQRYPDALLIVAPRHPSRGQALEQHAQSKMLTAARRSLDHNILPSTQIYIADTLGELGVFFSLSSLVFLGGSFGQEGGHNPYEPAYFGAALVHGSNVRNFADAYEALHLAGAAAQVESLEALGSVLVELISGGQLPEMAQAARDFMGDTQSGLLKYVGLIEDVLNHSTTP